MADNFTLSQNFLEGQQPNTAVLPRNDLFPQLMLQASEMQYRRQQAEKADHEKQIADMVKALDYDTADMNLPDQEMSQKEIQDYTDKWTTGSNMNSFIMKQENLPLILQRKQDEQKLKFGIDVGKQAKVIADKNMQLANSRPDLYDVDASQKYINEWLSTPRDERGVFQGLVTKPLFNLVKSVTDFTSTVPISTTTTKNANGTSVTTNSVEPKNFLLQVNSQYGDAINNEDFSKTANQLKQSSPHDMIPTWDYTVDANGNPNLFDKKTGQLAPTGQVEIANANPKDIWMSLHTGAYKNVISKDNEATYHASNNNGGGDTDPNNADVMARGKFIKEGLQTSPQNFSSFMIGGKINGGTITKVDVEDLDGQKDKSVPFESGSHGTIVPKTLYGKKSEQEKQGALPNKKITITYTKVDNNGQETTHTQTITANTETGYGFNEINNVMNQVHEGVKGYVSPEGLTEWYKLNVENNSAPTQQTKGSGKGSSGVTWK